MPTKNAVRGGNWSAPKTTSGVVINDALTTAHLITADAVAKRIAGVHPNALKRISSKPVYISAGLQEFQIKPHKDGGFYIWRYNGGQLAQHLQGRFTTFQDVETTLINHLKNTDRRNRAIWPGR